MCIITKKMLTDVKTEAVAAREFGLDSSTLLEMNKIKKLEIKAKIPVKEAVQSILKELKEQA